MAIAETRALLSSRAELLDAGMTDRGIAAAVRSNEITRVDYGRYVATDVWDAGFAEHRHLIRILAAEERSRGGEVVYSHLSACVLFGIPLFRVTPSRVHVSGPRADGGVARGPLARHQLAVPEGEIAEVSGIRCTSLERTVADTIRMVPREAGLSVADAGMRAVAWDDDRRAYDGDAAEEFRAGVGRRLPSGGRGVKQARRVLALADGRAASPGESVSRLYLRDLGFAPPRLQVPVRAPSGGWYFVDFGLDDVDLWGEFDGNAKYTDPAQRGADVTMQQALLAEKEREDWIRGTTGRRVIRWGLAHIASAATLRSRLLSFRVPMR